MLKLQPKLPYLFLIACYCLDPPPKKKKQRFKDFDKKDSEGSLMDAYVTKPPPEVGENMFLKNLVYLYLSEIDEGSTS